MSATTYPWTGPLSYSRLKHILTSPAAFRHACEHPKQATSDMRIGTCFHWHLLGGPRAPLVYRESKTKGEGAIRRWQTFQAEHEGEEIMSLDEWEAGRRMALAVRHAPHNVDLADHWLFRDGAEYETPLAWTLRGIPFATRGVDVLQRVDGLLVDLKKARTASPERFRYQARDLAYPLQLALYETAARAHGIDVRERAVFAVESDPPHIAHVYEIDDAGMVAARSILSRALDVLEDCLATGQWYGYTRSGVTRLEVEDVELDLSGIEEATE